MTASKSFLVEKIHHGIDPFAFYVASPSNIDMQGWNSNHPYLSSLVGKLRPLKIAEIGVWKGGSAITMANALRENDINGVVLSIDTFRGSPEHWQVPEHFKKMNVINGVPGIYDNFMTNVISKSLQDYVLPLPVDSFTAFEICKRHNLMFDLIHIDAGHEYSSVKNDLRIWSSLLNSNGVILMDDYFWDDEKNVSTGWHGVARAVNEFIENNSKKVSFEHKGGKCIIQY